MANISGQTTAKPIGSFASPGPVEIMRKATFGGAPSLDGYFARKDDAVDWLMWSNEAAVLTSKFWKTIDTIVMGRKTYEAALKMTGGKGNLYGGIKSYVFSRTLKPRKDGPLEIVAGDAVAFVRRLKKQPGKGICVMGGGDLARSLFEAGLIDEIGFNIHPVLLGSGIPLFHEMKRQIDLELLDCQRFKNGCVYVSYRVKPAKAKRRRK
jgi:dihydrofolate reductase